MKILICEDHTLLRQNMAKLFEQTPEISFIAQAKNGDEALEILKKTAIDVVLLDLRLPGMHGFVVLEKITAQWPAVKVLILSANAYEESAVEAFQKGAWSYLNKDIDSDILIEAMFSLYNGKKYILPEVMKLLDKQQNSNAPAVLHKKLTEREYEVMILLAKENSYNKISGELHLSKKTVGTHRTNLMLKMGMKKNTELTKYCETHKMI